MWVWVHLHSSVTVPTIYDVIWKLISNLQWSLHIPNTCSKTKCQLGLLSRHFYHVDHPTAKLYKYTVLPLSDNCSIPCLRGICIFRTNPTNLNLSRSLQLKMVPSTGLIASVFPTCTSLLSKQRWPPLSTQCNQQKVSLYKRIL